MSAAPAGAQVLVTFAHPEPYRNDDFETPALRDAAFADIRRTLEDLGGRYLKPGQTLKIEVLNIDRAGMVTNWTPERIRIVTDATPPRIEVNYILQQKGRVLQQAHETIVDLDYLSNPAARFSSDPLIYEKETLRNWFRRRFTAEAQ